MSLNENNILDVHYNNEQHILAHSIIENKLIDIISRLLPVQGVSLGLNDNFFDLGGDSMMVIELISKAWEHGIKFNMQHVYEYPTIAGLASKAIYEPIHDLTRHLSNNVVSKTLSLLPNQSAYAYTKSMTIATYLLRPTFFLDKEKLESAIQRLIQRHEVLRISFIGNDLQWQQVVNPYISTPMIEYVHLENTFTDMEREQAINDYCHKLIKTMDIENKQVNLRAALFEWNSQQLFFLAIDHYSFDELSMKLFWNEFYSAYLGKLLPLIEIPYSAVVEDLFRLAKKWDYREDQLFWLKQHAQVVHIPKSVNNSSTINEGIKAKILVLQAKEWLGKFILNLTTSAGVQVYEVLLTAWVQTLSISSGLPGVTMILGSHNRGLSDGMVHTMGCFVTAYPLYFAAYPEGDARQTIDCLRTQLKQIPHKGMRYMLSMMIDPAWKETVFKAPQPSLGFNYLGEEEINQEMWMGTERDEFKGKLVSIRKGELLSGRHQATNGIPYLIIHCQVNTKSKIITLTCDYDSGHYSESFIDDVLALYQKNIQLYACQLAT